MCFDYGVMMIMPNENVLDSFFGTPNIQKISSRHFQDSNRLQISWKSPFSQLLYDCLSLLTRNAKISTKNYRSSVKLYSKSNPWKLKKKENYRLEKILGVGRNKYGMLKSTNRLLSTVLLIHLLRRWKTEKQTQSYCNIFRRREAGVTHWSYNKTFSPNFDK